MHRYWKKKKVSEQSLQALEEYLQDGPKNLASWGKLGRETLKLINRFELQIEERYLPINPDSLLKRIQHDLLTFQSSKQLQSDDSIQVFLTGSSKLKEVENLKDEILKLNIPYHEISVLAPDISEYVPLLEFVFADQIPYRISGYDITTQSLFKQGLLFLLKVFTGRWDREELLSLFDAPSFSRKHN